MHLKDGNIFKKNIKTGKSEKILFKEYNFPISLGDVSGGFNTKDNMKSISDLYKEMNLSAEKLKKMKKSKSAIARTRIEFWSRINTLFLSVVFIFVGFCLGIQNARGKRRNTSVLCFLVLISYYALFFTGVSMAKKGGYPPSLAVFLPTTIIALFGSYMYKKLEWIS